MKKFMQKSIIMMVAFVCVAANAQNLVDGTKLSKKEIAAYLNAHPTDSVKRVLASNDTMKIVSCFFKKDNRYLHKADTIRVKTVVETVEKVDSAATAALYKASVNTRFPEKLFEDNKRDTYYASTDTGKIVLRSKDKYGWGFKVFGGYLLAENISCPVVGAGVEYSRNFWFASVSGKLGKSKYTDNAEKAGESYWCAGAEGLLGFQPFKLDKYNCNRLFIVGGIGFESYETDSKIREMEDGSKGKLQTTGDYLYPTAGIRFEHRFFSTGNSVEIGVQWRQKKEVIQNTSTQTSNAVEFTAAWKFGICRNKIGMSKSAVKALAQ